MAEVVLGVVASGAGLASLAMQLFDSAKKLEKFVDTLKHAPETLTGLIFDLETLSLSLRELEVSRQAAGHHTAVLDRCIGRCQTSAGKIQAIVDKLEALIKNHGRHGRLYLAFKDREIKELLVDLEHAKSSLVFAHQMYFAEEIKRKMAHQGSTLTTQAANQVTFADEQRQRWRDQETVLAAHAVDHTSFADEQRRRWEGHNDTLALHTASIHSIQQTGIILTQQATSYDSTLATHTASLQDIQQTGLLLLQQLCLKSPGSAQAPPSDKAILPSLGTVERSSGLNQHRRPPYPKRSGRPIARYRFSLPLWFSQNVWSLSAARSAGLWNVTLQVYCYADQHTNIIRACEDGNLMKVRVLVSSGEAAVRTWTNYGSPSGSLRRTTLLEHLHLASDDEMLTLPSLQENLYILRPQLLVDTEKCRERHYEAWGRLLIEDSGMSVDIPESLQVRAEVEAGNIQLKWVNSPTVIDIITRNQVLPWQQIPIEVRFKIASDRMSCTPRVPSLALVMRLLGVERIDEIIAHLSGTGGQTILHLAATGAAAHMVQGAKSAGRTERDARLYETALNAWFEVAKDGLRHGAQVSPAAPALGLTPLMQGVTTLRRSAPWQPYALYKFLLRWTQMLHEHGVDLERYGGEEDRLLEAWSATSPMSALLPKKIIHGPHPRDWDLEFRKHLVVPIYQRDDPPGSWPGTAYLPAHLAWEPRERENAEGKWRYSHEATIWSSPLSLKETMRCGGHLQRGIHSEAYGAEWSLLAPLVDRHQDDNGAVTALCEGYWSGVYRPKQARPRSRSQPVSSRPREREHWVENMSLAHQWLPPFHLCVLDGKHKIGCVAAGFGGLGYSLDREFEYHWTSILLRDCVSGIHEPDDIVANVLKSNMWKYLEESRHAARHVDEHSSRTSDGWTAVELLQKQRRSTAVSELDRRRNQWSADVPMAVEP
ncbi:hypothetical protein LTR53_001531 [Teratosphaeriaceae sp. CCFEE 6253]|nr:hypothetical protein LTR53_001531 [Teratosphaeriaceae sp. CCFEE 6253]